jgi:hypothetical protein
LKTKWRVEERRERNEKEGRGERGENEKWSQPASFALWLSATQGIGSFVFCSHDSPT